MKKPRFPPMFPGALFIDNRELQATRRVLGNKSLFRYFGPRHQKETTKFEKEFARYLGVKRVLGTTSGTGSLYVAMGGLGLRSGDEVIMPAFTWVSTPAAAIVHGARPVLAEVDETLTIDPSDFESRITERTRAVVPVHMRGLPCDMDKIMRIATSDGISVLEDCAQACGGSFRGKKLGSIGDVGIFSFQLNKIITAGEGGAVATSDETIYAKCIMTHDVAANVGLGEWQLPSSVEPVVGINFRMSEIPAAILREQLRKLDSIVSRMRRNKKAIVDCLSEVRNIRFIGSNDPQGDAGVCVVLIADTSEQADAAEKKLKRKGIAVWRLYKKGLIDGHVYPYWRGISDRLGYDEKTCPKSLEILGRTVHIDVNPLLTRRHVDYIVSAVREAWSAMA